MLFSAIYESSRHIISCKVLAYTFHFSLQIFLQGEREERREAAKARLDFLRTRNATLRERNARLRAKYAAMVDA